MAAIGHADHVIQLHLAAGAHAQSAVDAGVEIDRNGGVRVIGGRFLASRETAARGHAHLLNPGPKLGAWIVAVWLFGLIGDQQLEDHLTPLFSAVGRRLHLHAGRRLPHARGSEHPLALDLNHAGAAVAVGAIARRRMPAQMRDGGALPLRHLPDSLARGSLDLTAIERELDRVGHERTSRKCLCKRRTVCSLKVFDVAQRRTKRDVASCRGEAISEESAP